MKNSKLIHLIKIQIAILLFVGVNSLFAQDSVSNLKVNAKIKDITCFGGNDGSIELMPKSNHNEYSYLWATGETTNSIYDLIAGEYSVQISSNDSKKDLLIFNVKEPKELSSEVIVHSDQVEKSNEIEVNTNGGISPYSYKWNSNVSIDGFISTELKSNNGSGGIMFDVKGFENLKINGFDVNLNSGKKTIDIYFKKGTFRNSEKNKINWTKIGSYNVVSSGVHTPTHISLIQNIHVNSRDIVSFFITSNSMDLIYNHYDYGLKQEIKNTNIQIFEGIGRGSKDFESTIFNNRYFSGRIYYQVLRPNLSSTVKNIKGAIEGEYTLTITDANRCSSTNYVILNSNTHFGNQTTQGQRILTDIENKLEIKALPNPSSGLVKIQILSHSNAIVELSIYDLTGKEVLNNKIKIEYGMNESNYELSHLPKGVYMLKVRWGNHSQTLRIVLN